MKKMLFALLLLVTGCTSRQERFEKFRNGVVDDLYSDSTFAHQLDESGLGIKLQNAPNYDSFEYYNHLFSVYNDSIIKSQEREKKYTDSILQLKNK